jgi:hypothetical protein
MRCSPVRARGTAPVQADERLVVRRCGQTTAPVGCFNRMARISTV